MKKVDRGLTPEGFDLGFKGEEFRLALEKLMQDLGLRMQVGWKGKAAYVQLVDAENPSDHAVTILKTTKDGRMRWCLDNERDIQVKYERAHCHECFAVVPEAKR